MKNSFPLVSVLMPVYNAAPYVEDAIRSILSQTFCDFEFLIINDGSTDESGEVIQRIHDERIVFINHVQNKGLVSSLNEGLRLANGKYIARMDNDDLAHPERLAKQVLFMEQHPEVGLSGTAYNTFGKHTKPVSVPTADTQIREMMLLDSPFGHPTVIMRKSVIENYELVYRQDSTPAEDYRMWYDFSKVTKLANLSDFLLDYRVHDSQISTSMSDAQRIKADTVRVFQLTDQGFQLSIEEQQLYCRILHHSPLPQTAAELESWRLVMRKIIAENQKLCAYNELWFDHIFMIAWQEAASRIKKYTLRHLWPLLVQPKPTSRSLGLIIGLRLATKCLMQWKARPVPVNSSPVI